MWAPTALACFPLAEKGRTTLAATRETDIVRGCRAITADTALRLARYFGTDARSWMNLQAIYDLRVAELAQAKRIVATVRPRAA